MNLALFQATPLPITMASLHPPPWSRRPSATSSTQREQQLGTVLPPCAANSPPLSLTETSAHPPQNHQQRYQQCCDVILNYTQKLLYRRLNGAETSYLSSHPPSSPSLPHTHTLSPIVPPRLACRWQSVPVPIPPLFAGREPQKATSSASPLATMKVACTSQYWWVGELATGSTSGC